jgi:preprotein translocase subunit YajC
VTHLVLAQETAASPLPSLLFLGLMVAVFWLFIIRPQRQRAKAQQELSKTLSPGEEVRTIGGIHGIVVSVDDESVVLRVEEGKIRVSRKAVGTRVGPDKPETESS